MAKKRVRKIKPLVPLQLEIAAAGWRKLPKLAAWLQAVASLTLAYLPTRLQPVAQNCQFTLLLTSDAVVKKLNRQWRGKDKPTNVLSFPHYEMRDLTLLSGAKEPVYVGDIAVSYQYVVAEAKKEHKMLINHLTHLMIHGILHLFGYDHETDSEAVTMEKLEKKLMAALGLPDPYRQQRSAKR